MLPMTTIRFRSVAISGALASARATFVTGPTGQSVISPGFSRAMRMMRSTADSATARPRGSGSAMSPNPLAPWTWSAPLANGFSSEMQAWNSAFEDSEIKDLVAYIRIFCKK